MNNDLRVTLYEQAKAWIYRAGENIRRKMNEPLTVDTKANAKDLVTTMDKETERYFAMNIKSTYPGHKLLSEEGYGDRLQTLDGIVWIVDPIDGTMNFVEQKRNFAISVGIYEDGVGEIGFIYNVMNDVLYSAKRGEGAFKNDQKLPRLQEDLKLEESLLSLTHYWLGDNPIVNKDDMVKLVQKVRGTRSYGSAALEFAMVAEGVLDGYLSMTLSPWDIGAGMIIVREVGGKTATVDGGKVNMLQNQPIVTAHPLIIDTIIKKYLQKGK
ncbi:MAG TPA: inositol monophosphatase family protein [Bacillota bacterium]|nr:inositol monophosphatase family protein [Bacillota bacterium]